MTGGVFFVSGVDTDAGKTFATGWLAREWRCGGVRAVTQKPVQTGCPPLDAARMEARAGTGYDILTHRALMGCGVLPEDREGLTSPEIFPYPASPHLAARLAGRAVDFARIDSALAVLAARYDAVLAEGAGGLMTPLADDLPTIDFVRARGWPLIFVTSGRLGSINHTLLALEAVRARGMRLHSLVFNSFPECAAPMAQDAERIFRCTLARNFPGADFLTAPIINL